MKKFGYKENDRVQSTVSGKFGTVYQDQTSSTVHVKWDDAVNVVTGAPERMLRIAPWHEISFEEARRLLTAVDFSQIDAVHFKNFTEAGLIMGGAVKAKTYKVGDRVKLKYKRMCGTVVSDQVQAGVWVHWDKNPEGMKSAVPVKDLETLYAPRDTDPVNPNQEAIDAIEKQRDVLKKEVEALQSRLRSLTQAKRMLERG
jgi:beta-lactam-binding protein with PASTA domain